MYEYIHNDIYYIKEEFYISTYITNLHIYSGTSELGIGLDKICLAKFEQNGQPKERSNSASKMGCQFCQKAKWAKNEL